MKKRCDFKKNIFLYLLTIFTTLTVFSSVIHPVFAIEEIVVVENQEDSEEDIKEEDKEKEDKKEKDEKDEDSSLPSLKAGETGILVDAASGRVLFEKNSDKKMYPASTTKIMTALLAIEAVEKGEASMDTQVEVTKEMLMDLSPDGTSIALKEGEIMSLENLLKGLMIPSGNDAANVIAMHIGKSITSFVDMMNIRATELGATGTHFANPHGLHDENHYTTAADMAKIACEAMKHFEFRDIVDIAHVKIPPTNKTEEERYYINTNGLLSAMRYTDYFYKGSIGIKTGYTDDAGSCLVSAAAKSGMELIGVVFGGETTADSHNDSAQMLDWGFANNVSILAIKENDMPSEIKVKQGRGTDTLTLTVSSALSVTVPKGTGAGDLEIRPNTPEAVYAPITAGEKVGTVSVLLEGEEIGSCDLLASKSVERSFFWPVMALGEWLWSKLLIRIICYTAVVMVVLFVLVFILGIYNNIKRANRYKRRRR